MPDNQINRTKMLAGYMYTHFCEFNPNLTACLKTIKQPLVNNINDLDKFLKVLHHLIKYKLIILIPSKPLIQKYDQTKNFYPNQIYKNYVIPLAVFFHYSGVNVKKMAPLILSIVPNQIYDRYCLDHVGEYFESNDKASKKPVHVIFIKEYHDRLTNLLNQRSTLITLFHEATHLIDNFDFNKFDNTDLIEYRYRWHEINAKFNSKVFYKIYTRLLSKQYNKYPGALIDTLNLRCAELDDLYTEIKENTNLINNWGEKTAQYSQSIQQIQNVQKRFYNLIEELEELE